MASSSSRSTLGWSGDAASRSARRIQQEHKELMEYKDCVFSAGPKDANLYEWVAALPGPDDTPYEGGVFFLSIKFPLDYPFSAPTVTFLTRIYHCNINSTALHSLLQEPNPHDPLVGSIATEYLINRQTHDVTAKKWTTRFAR